MNATAASGLRQARVRTPTLLQMEMVECGAACLGIILAHFGRIVPLPELRVACGVSRDGSKASSVLRAARAYGLEAKGYRKEIPQLAELRYPFIVFWNFNHFVVVEGAGRRGVYLNDPATGPRRVSFKEFDEAFTGVVLALHPGPSFERRGGRRGMLKGLAARVRASAGALALCCATALLLVIPGLALPALMQVFVDQVLVQRLDDWVRPVILGVLTAAVARAALAAVQARLLRRLQMKLSVSMSSRFVWHLFSLPASFYAQRYSGEIASRVGLNDGLAEKLSGPLVAAVVDSLMIGVYAVAMWQFDRTLTLIAMGMVAVNVVMLRRMARWQVDANRRLAQETGKLYGVTVSGLQAIRTIKASALESELFGRIAGHYTRTVNAQQRQTTASLYLWLVPRFVSSLMSLLILAIGGLRVMDGALTVGMLVAFQSLVASFLGPVNTLLGLDYMVQQLQADVTRLDDVLSNPTAGAPSDAAMPDGAVRLRGEVELADVRFGYNPLEPPLIDGLSLTVAPGQRIALVGGSGSGKSTVARLVAGLYAPTSGEVRFDGCPRDRLPPALLANSLAVVDQDILLFAGTIRDNLTLWDHTVPDDQIVRACRDALIHEDIVARPDGYDSLLAEGASNLSGGQRQRLDIARALVGDPAVIVLDEATSALDPETEHGIDLNLRRRGCSCIIVAHRLSTIRDADEIILLERGKVVERGTHAALMAAGGAYAALVALGDAGIETGAGVETSTGAGDAA